MRGQIGQVRILHRGFVVTIFQDDNHDAVKMMGAGLRSGLSSLVFRLLRRLGGCGSIGL